MKPITVKNEDGETIEIKYDSEGRIKIRHSDFASKYWGELREHSKLLRHPGFQKFSAAKGLDLNTTMAKELAEKMGGYVVIRGKSYIISVEEIALIHAAIEQAGGIVPNWMTGG